MMQVAELSLFSKQPDDLKSLIFTPKLPAEKLEQFMCMYRGVGDCLDSSCYREDDAFVPSSLRDDEGDSRVAGVPVRDLATRVPMRSHVSTARVTGAAYLQQGMVRSLTVTFSHTCAE
jgi:hypothetical protein